MDEKIWRAYEKMKWSKAPELGSKIMCYDWNQLASELAQYFTLKEIEDALEEPHIAIMKSLESYILHELKEYKNREE